MFRHRQRAFGRKNRARITRVAFLLVLALMGALAGRAIQDELSPRLRFSPPTAAYGVGPWGAAAEASAAARVSRDLATLEDLWGVGGGPVVGVHYIEPPRTIRAGAPLRVAVRGTKPNGQPFAAAFVEVSWKFGSTRYRDVTQTDSSGRVEVTRDVDDESRGKQCVVAVRMYRDELQGMAYTTFTPR